MPVFYNFIGKVVCGYEREVNKNKEICFPGF